MPIYYAKNSVKNISLYLKFLTYVQYRHNSGYDKEMTSLYGWYDSPSPANDFKCVRIFQHENNKNSDKGAWYRTTDRKFSRFYCFAWATEVIVLALLSLRSERGAPWIWHLCSSTRHENTRPLTLEIVESH